MGGQSRIGDDVRLLKRKLKRERGMEEAGPNILLVRHVDSVSLHSAQIHFKSTSSAFINMVNEHWKVFRSSSNVMGSQT